MRKKPKDTTLKEDLIFFLVALVVIPGVFFIIVGIVKLIMYLLNQDNNPSIFKEVQIVDGKLKLK